jgi:hypothetical protein
MDERAYVSGTSSHLSPFIPTIPYQWFTGNKGLSSTIGPVSIAIHMWGRGDFTDKFYMYCTYSGHPIKISNKRKRVGEFIFPISIAPRKTNHDFEMVAKMNIDHWPGLLHLLLVSKGGKVFTCYYNLLTMIQIPPQQS